MFYSYELESALLGTCIMFPDAYYSVCDKISSECFYDDRNKLVYKALLEQSKQGNIDMITVTESCRKVGNETMKSLNGSFNVAAYVTGMCQNIYSFKNASKYVESLNEYRQKRLMLSMIENIRIDLDNKLNVDEIVNNINKEILSISDINNKEEIYIEKCMSNFVKMLDTPYTERLIPTLIPELDKEIGGFEHSDLVIIAGVSSMGKTSFALKMAKNLALQGKSVCIFSLEMNEEQLMTRFISDETMIPIRKIRYGDITEAEMERIRNAVNKIGDSKMIIDCKSTNLSEICNKIRKLKIRDNIELCVVDYLQLVQYNNRNVNREQEVATIVRALKNLARELEIVIVALSQLNRQVDQRDDKRPRLGDLRESGEIEQAADNVLFVYRPAYYDLENHDEVQEVDIIVSKGRNTGIGKATIKFIPKCTKFLSGDESENMILN